MISVDGLTVEFGGTTLFSDISFQINEKDRIALMGKNGAGKSTLLKILAGVRQPSRGKVSAPKDCVIAYLPQHLMTEDGRTVFEEASQAFSHLHVMEAEIEAINKELETRTDYESDSYMELIEKVSAMSEKFYSIDLTHFEEDVEKALLGLGFMREDFNRPTSDFSGGWRMRIELAKLLLQNPDVLLSCISRSESGSEVQAYWEKHSFSLPFSAQNDDAVFSLFASHTIPRILITDKEGIIRAVYTDDPLATYQELAKDIDAVLIDKLSGNER